MYEAINLLNRIATESLTREKIDHGLWQEFMEKMGHPLVRHHRPGELDEARKTWFAAYKHWLELREALLASPSCPDQSPGES